MSEAFLAACCYCFQDLYNFHQLHCCRRLGCCLHSSSDLPTRWTIVNGVWKERLRGENRRPFNVGLMGGQRSTTNPPAEGHGHVYFTGMVPAYCVFVFFYFFEFEWVVVGYGNFYIIVNYRYTITVCLWANVNKNMIFGQRK